MMQVRGQGNEHRSPTPSPGRFHGALSRGMCVMGLGQGEREDCFSSPAWYKPRSETKDMGTQTVLLFYSIPYPRANLYFKMSVERLDSIYLLKLYGISLGQEKTRKRAP